MFKKPTLIFIIALFFLSASGTAYGAGTTEEIITGRAFTFEIDGKQIPIGHEITEGEDVFQVKEAEFVFPLPADFFGPGSDPFDNLEVKCESGDTTVKRLEDATLPPPPPSSDTVPIELVDLSLKSCEPVTVHYEDGTTQEWDVQVDLSQVLLGGEMTIHKTRGNGGSFDASLPVQPRFVFTKFFDVEADWDGAKIILESDSETESPDFFVDSFFDVFYDLSITDAPWVVCPGAPSEFCPGSAVLEGEGAKLILDPTTFLPPPAPIALVPPVICGTETVDDDTACDASTKATDCGCYPPFNKLGDDLESPWHNRGADVEQNTDDIKGIHTADKATDVAGNWHVDSFFDIWTEVKLGDLDGDGLGDAVSGAVVDDGVKNKNGTGRNPQTGKEIKIAAKNLSVAVGELELAVEEIMRDKSLGNVDVEPGLFRCELKDATVGQRTDNYKDFTVTKPQFGENNQKGADKTSGEDQFEFNIRDTDGTELDDDGLLIGERIELRFVLSPGSEDTSELSIEDRENNPVRTINFFECVPTEYQPPSVRAGDDSLLEEHFQFKPIRVEDVPA